ncbi:MAG: DUF4112 domain-containing protein [Thainema sp.]
MQPPHSPDPSPVEPRQRSGLERVRALSHLLDNAIAVPGTDYRFGVDPLIGLLPGGGDTVTGLISAYIIWEAALLGMPRSAMIRMVWNVLLEVIVGTIPFVGDFFDFAWKANARNVRLLEKHLANPRTSRRADRAFALVLIGLLLLIIVAAIGVSVWVLSAIVGAVAD